MYQHCVYGSDGLPVFINDIMAVVQEETSPHLSGKPKLFFIQVTKYLLNKQSSVLSK